MPKTGPILVIDDDMDDLEMIARIFAKLKLPNPIKQFHDGEEALTYLKSTSDKPLLIMCDINMPIIDGLQLKGRLNQETNPRIKNIPFVILSTTADSKQVEQAYQLNVQGFFVKGESYDVLSKAVQRIIEYWMTSLHPNH